MRAKLNFVFSETYFSVLNQIQNIVKSNNFADSLQHVNAKPVKPVTIHGLH